MKNLKTTILGIAEAACLGITAESMFDLTLPQRGAIIGLAVLRASFGVLAADARSEPTLVTPAQKKARRRVG